MFCREQLAQLRQHQQDFASRGARLVVAAQDRAIIEVASPLEAYCDPGRDIFREFGFGETDWKTFLEPRVWGQALRSVFKGNYPGPSQGNVYQMGGQVVLDRDGRVLFHRASESLVELVDIAEILRVLDRGEG